VFWFLSGQLRLWIGVVVVSWQFGFVALFLPLGDRCWFAGQVREPDIFIHAIAWLIHRRDNRCLVLILGL
jgi:Uma2 family endonuclease